MMARMKMDYKDGFLTENVATSRAQCFKYSMPFGSEIFEIFQKCCCNTKFLQEIAFYYLVRIFEVFIP